MSTVMHGPDIRALCLKRAEKTYVPDPHLGGPVDWNGVLALAGELAAYFVSAKDFDTAKCVIERGRGYSAKQIIDTGEATIAFLTGATAPERSS